MSRTLARIENRIGDERAFDYHPAPSADVPKPATNLEFSVTRAPKTTNGGRQAEPDPERASARAPVVTKESPWDDLDIPDDLRRF